VPPVDIEKSMAVDASNPAQDKEKPVCRRPGNRQRRGLLLLAGAWLVFISLPPLGLAMARERLLAWQSSPAAQQEWDRFRSAMRVESTGEGPVQRKVPKSQEPPLKVWLRDYFALAIAAWILFGSVVFLVTGTLALGAWADPPVTK
jgi:hypothetical protein